ncbi:MMPL family transporter [Nonomuraea sp. SYSU D8015]|uniref:MMPL family transporter n=1 Tax=Nonomuraea sp. SYSU D8015 TaxID=2593644 RepID=UPI00166039D5|nr:MMPL family transporter [Nonomuraea sp. SYSU D8015]
MSVPAPGTEGSPAGRLAARYARVVVRFRYLVVGFWVTAAAVSWFVLPDVSQTRGGGIEGLVPLDTPAVQMERRAVELFDFPLLGRTVIVQHDPAGLSPYAQAEPVALAMGLLRGQFEEAGPILGALPLSNSLGLLESNERGTGVVTYLLMPPTAGFAYQMEAAERFAERHLEPDDAYVGVTGSVPARVEQQRIVERYLPLVELATVTVIALIVCVTFGSVAAPLLALLVSGLAFVLTIRLAAVAARLLGVPMPAELEPLLVALQLGIVTDYVIFFLSGLRARLAEGRPRLEAACRSAVQFGPIVAVAGVTVAAGTASLLVTRSQLFRAFGPGMALAVLVALLVAITLVPALMAIVGRWLFWPFLHGRYGVPRTAGRAGPADRARESRIMRVLTRRGPAAVVASACILALVLAALPIGKMRLGLDFVGSLPAGDPVRRAAVAAQQAFAPGILSPTVVLLEGDGIAERPTELAKLGDRFRRLPGVAGVIAPGERLPAVEAGILLSRERHAARYLIILDDEPLGAAAIKTVNRLQDRLPEMLAQSGLGGVRAGVAGDTAIAAHIVAETTNDLVRISVAAILVNLLVLVVFLRALVAPLYLLASSVLSVAASLGLAVHLFQTVFGHAGLTFYVPFAAGVLLVALGSDYNIFGIGHVWKEARNLGLRRAIIVAVPQSTRAITAAGVTLAASFGLLAIVPLRPFHELAFAMALGILLDVIVVRSLMLPTLLGLVRRISGWPGRTFGWEPDR